jgi:hypothetical protein
MEHLIRRPMTEIIIIVLMIAAIKASRAKE